MSNPIVETTRTGHIESAESGYKLAKRLHDERSAAGWRAVGRKIGFTNRTIWARYGVYQPIFGFVYDRTVTYAPEGSATLSLAGLAQPRMEPEICFGLRSAPPRSKDPAELLAAIEWVAPGQPLRARLMRLRGVIPWLAIYLAFIVIGMGAPIFAPAPLSAFVRAASNVGRSLNSVLGSRLLTTFSTSP